VLDNLIKLFQYLFRREEILTPTDSSNFKTSNLRLEPEVHYETLTVVDKTPSNVAVSTKAFIVVIYRNQPIWALFRCPCGCGTVISLSLQKVHTPHWTAEKTSAGRPTIYPSIWQNKGCYSHFWIKDGRVYWCHNTGIEPWVAEPSFYSKSKKSDKGNRHF
jgi:hypothetical protein